MRTLNGLLCLSFSLILFAGCQKTGAAAPAQHIAVVMKKYTIEPGVIKVKAGTDVELEVTSADVQHGFDIPTLGIKEPVQPGKPAIIRFKAPAKGEYGIECGIICGPRHEEMLAKLVVE
ncbi:MAG TPA: cupredoxin domain-containing protein [Alphaproteobacteria bacterium]|nr:cupredoxin domain-containing protein [Alphaproteobacteria bacterium]